MLLETVLQGEIKKVYARMEELEHICRQMNGTIEVFVKSGKIQFLNSDVEKTFHEIMAKWNSELGPRQPGRRRKVT